MDSSTKRPISASELSIGFQNKSTISSESCSSLSGKKQVPRPSTVKTVAPPPVDDSIENVCCLLLQCDSHKRIAIKKFDQKNGALFLPYITFNSSDSWKSIAVFLIRNTLNRIGVTQNYKITNCIPELIDVYRVQLPKTLQYYTRITVLARIIKVATSTSTLETRSMSSNYLDCANPNAQTEQTTGDSEERCHCSITTSTITWLGLDEMNRIFNNSFWGPEALIFYKKLQLQENDEERFEMKKKCSDYSIQDSVAILTGKEPGTLREKKLLQEAGYTTKVVVNLFNEFILHCYPSRYMTFNSFKSFMSKMFWHCEDVVFQTIFNSLNLQKTNFLSFDELLLGFAAMDTSTPHSGESLLIRLEYIFRFYDFDADQRLCLSEFVRMTNDIIIKNQDCMQADDESELAKKLINIFTSAISRMSNAERSYASGLSLEQFLEVTISHQDFCQLTGQIFRAPFCLLVYISSKFNYNLDLHENQLLRSCGIISSKCFKVCHNCKRTRFNISNLFVRFSDTRDFLELQLLDVVLKGANVDRTVFAVDNRTLDNVMLANDIITRIKTLAHQLTGFGTGSVRMRNEDNFKLWYFTNRFNQQEAIKKILVRVKEIVATESKVLYLSSPCYVISGLFGNLRDLIRYTHYTCSLSPYINKSTYVFLGNIIDPQPWSLECLVYLLAMKMIAPNRFILLRGYNEVREHQECQRDPKFAEVWPLANEILDMLPLAAVIENRIFCSTSGYPQKRVSLNSLSSSLPISIPNPMNDERIRDIL